MIDGVIEIIIQQGGFAVLAGVGFYLMFRMNERHVDDLKKANEREQFWAAKMLDVLQENTAAITNLTDEIADLRERRRREPMPPSARRPTTAT